MEKKVLFRDNQETQADDFNNMSDWITQSLDDIVFDTIESSNAYAGLGASKTAPTQITIATGRVYWGGKVYTLDTPFVMDFFSNLPITQKKLVAVVAFCQTNDTDVQPRNFIIDASTGQSQPQSVAMTETRAVQISNVIGVEATTPVAPPVSGTTIQIAQVTLDPTGVILVTQTVVNQVPNLAQVEAILVGVQALYSQIQGEIGVLTTTLANLQAQLANFALESDLQNLANQIALLLKKMQQPVSYTWYGTDYFIDTSHSQPAANVDGAYLAFISEGLRFPGGSTGVTTLQLLNPSDPGIVIGSDGLMLPKPSGARARIDASLVNQASESHPWPGPPGAPGVLHSAWVSEWITTYQYVTVNIRLLTRSRHRHCVGPFYDVNDLAIIANQQALQDPVVRILSFTSESWEVKDWTDIIARKEDNFDWPRYKSERRRHWWHDSVDLPYWSRNAVTSTLSGYMIAQTFLNAQDGWLTGLTFFADRPWQSSAANLDILVVACDEHSVPDFDSVLCHITLTPAQAAAATGNAFVVGDVFYLWIGGTSNDWASNAFPVRVAFPPVFLEGGRQYAFVLASTNPGAGFEYTDSFDAYGVHQGTLFVSGSTGLYQWTAGNKSLRFMAWYATWTQWQGQSTSTQPGPISIAMQPLQLSGGINGIEVLAEAVIPAICDLSYQVQITGGWCPFDPDPDDPPFTSNPALLPFRVVFDGTTDLMPAVNITLSQVTIRGQLSNTIHHISDVVTFGSASTHLEGILKVNKWNAAHQTLSQSIHYGTTHMVADVVTDEILDDNTLVRTSTFFLNHGSVTSAPTLTGGAVGVAASGTIIFNINPSPQDWISLNGSKVTFVSSGATGLQVNIGVSLAATLTALNTFLNASADSQIVLCTYSVTGTTLTITDKTTGVGGNSFTIAQSVLNPVTSAVWEIDGTTDGTVPPFVVKQSTKFAAP